MLYGEINQQRLKIINEHVVADTIDYLEARFAFSEDWDGLEKWVHFAKDGAVYDIRLTDDCVRKEDHLNLSAGIWKVYLHGNEFSGGKVIERITTNAAILKVEPTGTLDGEPFPEMPASVTEQILARLENVEQNGGGTSIDEIYILSEEETVDDAPDTAKEIIDPYDDTKPVDFGQFATKEDLRELSGDKADYASVPNKATVDGSTLKMQRETTTTDAAGTETTETTDLFVVELPSGGGGGWAIDDLTAETVIANDDAVPFYDTSAKAQRKTLWSNIKTVLKTYFDGEYLKLSGGILTGEIVLPTGNQNVGFTNSEDQKIFGYGPIDSVSHMRIGDVGKPLQLRGSGERPKYNNDTLVLKTEFDTALGSYITDIDALIGGDA